MNPFDQQKSSYSPFSSLYNHVNSGATSNRFMTHGGRWTIPAIPSAPLPCPVSVTQSSILNQPIQYRSDYTAQDTSYPYVLVVLERPTLEQPWGLSLTLRDGHVECSCSSSSPFGGVLPSAAWCTKADRSPIWWWKYNLILQHASVLEKQLQFNNEMHQFLHGHSWITLPRGSIYFQEGDAIVAINGQLIPGPCQNLDLVCQICSQAKRMVMLLVRRKPIAPARILPVVSPIKAPEKRKTPPVKTPPQVPSKCQESHSKSDVATIRRNKTPSPQTSKSTPKIAATRVIQKVKPDFVLYRNERFKDPKNPSLALPYEDDLEFEPDEGRRASLFLRPVHDVTEWIQSRKRKWRESYKVYPLEELWLPDRKECRPEKSVAVDFWSPQGFGSLQDWLRHRTSQWRLSYSWQKSKRQRIQKDVENPQNVCPSRDFQEWLRVRKTQWRLARRQRQRAALSTTAAAPKSSPVPLTGSPTSPSLSTEDWLMDGLLEEKEQKERQRLQRPPLNISWLFDVNLGCPDDVVAHCMSFLRPEEHGKFLALNRETRYQLSNRETVWRLLCPKHWTLPRRPRQPWHVLYWTKLKTERKEATKRWDDLLARALNIIAKGDHLSSLERIVNKAEKEYQFDVNYSSGVVCERNSLLNLAVIHQRHKIVRWLVEEKEADLESADRGDFTPLLNAAWAGDKVLVRFLMARGANRRHVGTSHYTRPLAVDFDGHDAAGWAEDRGYADIAKLIRMGL